MEDGERGIGKGGGMGWERGRRRDGEGVGGRVGRGWERRNGEGGRRIRVKGVGEGEEMVEGG